MDSVQGKMENAKVSEKQKSAFADRRWHRVKGCLSLNVEKVVREGVKHRRCFHSPVLWSFCVIGRGRGRGRVRLGGGLVGGLGVRQQVDRALQSRTHPGSPHELGDGLGREAGRNGVLQVLDVVSEGRELGLDVGVELLDLLEQDTDAGVGHMGRGHDE